MTQIILLFLPDALESIKAVGSAKWSCIWKPAQRNSFCAPLNVTQVLGELAVFSKESKNITLYTLAIKLCSRTKSSSVSSSGLDWK